MDREKAQAAVAEALRQLERSLERLLLSIAHDAIEVQVAGALPDREGRRLVADAYGAINLQRSDEPNKSVVCLGIVGVSPEIHQLAARVNLAKSALKLACAPLQTMRTRVPNPTGGGTKALPLIRVILRAIQRSDLNLLAAYRRIPLLEVTPARIAYTRAHTRSVYRKRVDEIEALLISAETPAAADDRAKLRTLPKLENHLALVRERYENVRANITLPTDSGVGTGRRLIAAELPIMYPRGADGHGPSVQFPEEVPAPGPGTARARRSKLQDRPFLQTLPAYRYLAP